MLLRELIKANDQALLEGDFSAYINHLYQLGVLLEKDFVQDVKDNVAGTFADEADKKKRFYQYIVNFFTFKFLRFPPSEQILYTRLWNLQSFLMAWEDPALRKPEDKKLRQTIKFKGDIDKYFRRRLHAALIAEVTRMQNEVGIFIEKEVLPIHCELDAELINCLTACINSLKSKTPDHIGQTFEKAAKAISTFRPTADKFLHGFSIFIGLLTALACGLATGGFLFLLLSGFGVPLVIAALIGLAMFGASTYANFGLFAVHSSKFLRALSKSGGITEFIDKEGRRTQLPMSIKCLLALGAVFSVGVGLSSASLTIMFGMMLFSTLFPTLPVALPSIIVGILVFGMTIGLSLVIFKAWVYLLNLLRTKFSSWGDFLEWITKEIKEIKNLTATQLLSYLFQVAFMGFALFGLFFLCFAGIPSLAPALTSIGSWVVGFAAFLGDLPFTVITIFNFCSSFKQLKLFSRTDSIDIQQVEELSSSPDKKPLFARIMNSLLLVSNAIGRSIQVFDGRLISVFAAIACFFSALAGTLSKQDDYEENSRNKANKTSKKLLIQVGYKTDGNINIETVPVSANQSLGYSSLCRFFSVPTSPSSPASEHELNCQANHSR